jgi:hypothetical protein
MGTLDSRGSVHILASTIVPFTLTTVQVPNSALTHTKRITLHKLFFALILSGRRGPALESHGQDSWRNMGKDIKSMDNDVGMNRDINVNNDISRDTNILNILFPNRIRLQLFVK